MTPFLRPLLALLAFSGTARVALYAADVSATPSSVRLVPIPATDEGLPGAGPIRRAEWFQQVWAERRTGWAGRVQQDQGALVFLGDSITHGWTSLASTFPGVKVANRGIGGDTTRGVLIRLQDDVLALNPRGIVLLIGTNDIEEASPPETVTGNLDLILAACQQHNPKMPVVLCQVMPSSAEMRRPAATIRKLNELYLRLNVKYPQVTVLDTWALFANDKGDARPSEFPDLLHLNPASYHKWAAALRPILETLGLVPAWPDDFTPESGFVSLFNGRDLTGWQYAGTPLDGRTGTDDGRFVVANGRLVVTVSRTLRDFRKLWTSRTFPQDFVLKLECRASPNADSGIYIREPQLQCRDYLLAGPFANLKSYRPLDWNEIVITVKGGLAHATCNGEVLIDAMAIPADGPIGVESDRGQMEFRRLRISPGSR